MGPDAPGGFPLRLRCARAAQEHLLLRSSCSAQGRTVLVGRAFGIPLGHTAGGASEPGSALRHQARREGASFRSAHVGCCPAHRFLIPTLIRRMMSFRSLGAQGRTTKLMVPGLRLLLSLSLPASLPNGLLGCLSAGEGGGRRTLLPLLHGLLHLAFRRSQVQPQALLSGGGWAAGVGPRGSRAGPEARRNVQARPAETGRLQERCFSS